VVAEAASFRYAHVEDIIQRARQAGTPLLAVVADGIQDPQNLGTLIRSAEAAGAHGVIIRERRAAGVTPAVIKASAGAVEYLPIARVVNLVRTLDDLKRAGAWVYALETEPSAPTYNTVDLTVPVAIVVGSEGRGVGRLVKQVCDGILRIPLRGHVGSLNAAVAASIVLYEVVRQRSS
jgi:23S rRNA (guanosine2251-2'-O)-methyltransferase